MAARKAAPKPRQASSRRKPAASLAPTIHGAAFADLLGVHPNTVTNWITKEQLPILRRVGRVVELDLATAVQWVRAREQRAFDDKLKALTTSPDVQRAQYRKAVAAAERAELELGRLRGDLVPRSDVERLWSSHILRVRARLLSLPAHARVRGVGPEAVLEQLIRQALEDLARGEDEAA